MPSCRQGGANSCTPGPACGGVVASVELYQDVCSDELRLGAQRGRLRVLRSRGRRVARTSARRWRAPWIDQPAFEGIERHHHSGAPCRRVWSPMTQEWISWPRPPDSGLDAQVRPQQALDVQFVSREDITGGKRDAQGSISVVARHDLVIDLRLRELSSEDADAEEARRTRAIGHQDPDAIACSRRYVDEQHRLVVWLDVLVDFLAIEVRDGEIEIRAISAADTDDRIRLWVWFQYYGEGVSLPIAQRACLHFTAPTVRRRPSAVRLASDRSDLNPPCATGMLDDPGIDDERVGGRRAYPMRHEMIASCCSRASVSQSPQRPVTSCRLVVSSLGTGTQPPRWRSTGWKASCSRLP
jgi:hypothetical protein